VSQKVDHFYIYDNFDKCEPFFSQFVNR